MRRSSPSPSPPSCSPPPAAAQTKREVQPPSRAPGKYGTAGCGLGSLAFGDTPGAIQILAATTNTLFGTQTFGITTGTSNCGTGLFAMGTKNFVEANREALAKDISRGEGEAIGALTVINACGTRTRSAPRCRRTSRRSSRARTPRTTT